MLKFQLLQVQDIKEAAAIERRRRNEEERKKRIFNAKNRLIGADYDSLDKQIQEKKQRDEEQKKLDEIFAEQQKRNAQLAIAYEKKEMNERRKIIQEINNYRQVYQKPEDRREFDLNDPHYISNSLPARIDDDDPRISISSAQKFEGEDLASEARKKLQTEQTKAFLEQQVREQRAAVEELKAAEEAYQAAVVARDMRATELNNLEKDCRKKLDQAMARFNKSMLEQQQVDKQIKHRQELEDNFAEMYNAVTGDLLTENPSQSQSNFGPNRPIGYMYKGMTQEEKDVIRKQQLLQIEENKAKREEEKMVEKYWADYDKGTGRTICKLDMEEKLKRKELNKQMAEFNKSLAEEQKAYNDYLHRVVYANRPTAAYFAQFNTTSR